MDYLQKKIIQKNEKKINQITQKMEEKLKKYFKQLDPKRAKTTKRIKNENDDAITKIKLRIKKALIVEYIQEKEYSLQMYYILCIRVIYVFFQLNLYQDEYAIFEFDKKNPKILKLLDY